MKKLFRAALVSVLTLAAGTAAVKAADVPQKHEMRSAWVATVWRLDWPSNTISSTGNESQIARQKEDMIRMLDSLHVNNMNAINFQVRSRCDAMYKSSYEPWSSDLVEERGLDPGYDPLAFVVEECHKRGMECHAWINPYRYESVVNQWDGTPNAYRKDHPDWLLDVEGASILNPGLPEVTQRICDVIAEIVTNYDVDGVLFDDYFYLSHTKPEQDGDLYQAYKDNGGTLSQGDWRRDNVNRMVAAVYKTIKDIKPYVRFGVSPAGIACTSGSVANQYGISPCPTGGDWQYNDIYSDPIAWISQQSLDFISPQIYWTIGASTDYDKAAKWWSEIAHKWNRHFYSSHSISSLTASSKAPGLSIVETDKRDPMASGPNDNSFEEYANEVRLNRQYNLDNAPGSIFYSCKYMYKNAPLFAHYLSTTVFNTPALIPSMSWFPVSSPGNVSDVQRAGNKLSWKGLDNVRYTVYAVPSTLPESNFGREAEYLLGVSYTNEYTIPDRYLSGCTFAVCVYDRYGNEYSPVFVGATVGKLDAPEMISPVNGESVEMPFDFKWKPVEKATNYIVEISDKSDMSDLLYTKGVEATECSSSEFYRMPIEKDLYWRVRSCGNSYEDGVSPTTPFTARNLEFSYPQDGDTAVALCPTMKWTFGERDVVLQISKNKEFNANDIFYQAEASHGSITLPKYVLAYYKTYYARLLYVRSGIDCISDIVSFTTVEGVPEMPSVSSPLADQTLYADGHITLNPIEGMHAFRIEVCASSSFPTRSLYVQPSVDMNKFIDPKSGAEIKISNKGLEDGKTYYLRVRGTYMTRDGSVNTEYSPVSTFKYSSENSGVTDITVDEATEKTPSEFYTIDGRRISKPVPGTIFIDATNRKVKVGLK